MQSAFCCYSLHRRHIAGAFKYTLARRVCGCQGWFSPCRHSPPIPFEGFPQGPVPPTGPCQKAKGDVEMPAELSLPPCLVFLLTYMLMPRGRVFAIVTRDVLNCSAPEGGGCACPATSIRSRAGACMPICAECYGSFSTGRLVTPTGGSDNAGISPPEFLQSWNPITGDGFLNTPFLLS
jgi:hypothetical protein